MADQQSQQSIEIGDWMRAYWREMGYDPNIFGSVPSTSPQTDDSSSEQEGAAQDSATASSCPESAEATSLGTSDSTSAGPGDRLKVMGLTLSKSVLDCLRGEERINDQVMNAYFLLMAKAHTEIFALDSFAANMWAENDYSRLYKMVTMSDKKWIFVPVNVKYEHWVLLWANVPKRQMGALDSLNQNCGEYLELFQNFMKIRSSALRELKFFWTEVPSVSTQQTHKNDGGVFVIMNAMALTNDLEPKSFHAFAAAGMRRKILKEFEAAHVTHLYSHAK